MFCQQSIVRLEMAGFLVVHVLHERTEVRVCCYEGRGLRGVDDGGGKFASLVYAQLNTLDVVQTELGQGAYSS